MNDKHQLDISEKLTIVIPVFNGERYLEEALESTIRTGANIIVSDDGSTDRTREICNKYSNHISYNYHSNMGQINTLNLEWSKIQTKYISYINCDDLWVAEAKEYCKDAITFLDNNSDFVMCTPNQLIIDEKSKVIRKVSLPPVSVYSALVKKECNVAPGVIFRRNKLTPWNNKYRLFADVIFYAELSSKGNSKNFKDYYSCFRKHDGSFAFSTIDPKKWHGLGGIVRNKIKEGLLKEEHRRDAVAWNIGLVAREYMLLGKYRRSFLLFFKAFKISKLINKINIFNFFFRTVARRLILIKQSYE